MQNLVIMNLAVWNWCWNGGHHVLWWQNTVFFSLKLLSILFTTRGRMEFPYRNRSLLTLVIAHKSIFLLRRYLVRTVQNKTYGVKWVYYRPLHYVLYRHHIVLCSSIWRSYDRMLWALLLPAGHNILWRQHLTGNSPTVYPHILWPDTHNKRWWAPSQ